MTTCPAANAADEPLMTIVTEVVDFVGDEVTVQISIKGVANVLKQSKDIKGISEFYLSLYLDESSFCFVPVLATDTEYFDVSVSDFSGITNESLGLNKTPKSSRIVEDYYSTIYYVAFSAVNEDDYIKNDGVLLNVKLKHNYYTPKEGLYYLFHKNSGFSFGFKIGDIVLFTSSRDFQNSYVVIGDKTASYHVDLKQHGVSIGQNVIVNYPLTLEFKDYIPSSDLRAFVAGYDKDGKLDAFRCFKLDEANVTAEIEADTFPPDGLIKIFIWEKDMTTDIAPLIVPTRASSSGNSTGEPDLYFRYVGGYSPISHFITSPSEGPNGTRYGMWDDESGESKGGIYFGGQVGNHYLYVTAPTNYIEGGRHVVKVSVTYIDNEPRGAADAGIVFEYSSANRPDDSGRQWGSERRILKTGTGLWKTETFILPDMKFVNSLNGNCIRIASDRSSPTTLHSVEMEILDSEPPANPTDVRLVSVGHDYAEFAWDFPKIDNVWGVLSRERQLRGVAFYNVAADGTETYIGRTPPAADRIESYVDEDWGYVKMITIRAAENVVTTYKISGLGSNTAYNIKLKSYDNLNLPYGNGPLHSSGVGPIEAKTLDWWFNDYNRDAINFTAMPGAGGGKVTASAAGNYYGEGGKPAVMLVALYDGDKMVDLVTDEGMLVGTTRSDNIRTTITVPPSDGNDYWIGAYLWDSVDGMNGLAACATMNAAGVKTNGVWKILNKSSGKVTVGSVDVNGGKVAVTSTTPAGAGRNVAICVKEKDSGAVHYVGQGVSGANGEFTFEFSMGDIDGTYQLYVNGDDASISVPVEFKY